MIGVEPDSEGWARDGLEPSNLLAPLAVSESPLADETYESVMEMKGLKDDEKKNKWGSPSFTPVARTRVG